MERQRKARKENTVGTFLWGREIIVGSDSWILWEKRMWGWKCGRFSKKCEWDQKFQENGLSKSRDRERWEREKVGNYKMGDLTVGNGRVGFEIGFCNGRMGL